MKNQKSQKSTRQPAARKSPASRPKLVAIEGIRELRLLQGPKGVNGLVAKIDPHFTIMITGGRKPSLALMYSHHGVRFEHFDLNCKFEQVISQLRTQYPELRVD